MKDWKKTCQKEDEMAKKKFSRMVLKWKRHRALMFREGALVTFGRYQTLLSSINTEKCLTFSFLFRTIFWGVRLFNLPSLPSTVPSHCCLCYVLFVQNRLHAQHFFLYLALTLFPNAIRVNLVELPIWATKNHCH